MSAALRRWECTPHFLFVLPKRKRAVHGPKEKALWSQLDTGVKLGDAALLAPLWKIAGACVGAGMVLLKFLVEAPR